jgi:carboxymethylenebutenolidase
MHEYIKDVVRRFAQRGFFAITFEPYTRTGGVLHIEDREAMLKVVNAVPDAQVMADLDAIVAYAKKQPYARGDRIGVTGFCRGGLYTLLFAARSPEVKAAVAWYGQIKPAKTAGIREAGPLDVAAQIKAPVLGLYGEADQGIPLADVREMEAALKAAGRTAEFVVYPEAPHAFHADYRPSYRENPAKDAWARGLAWFKKYLHV